MPTSSAEEVIQAWDRNAEKAAAGIGPLGDRNKEVLLTPRVLEWLGEIHGLEALDAGCGEGFLCRLMAEMGARVTGIDYSGEMLKIARQRTPPKTQIDYHHLNLEDLTPIAEARFDLIVSLLALQDLPDYHSACGNCTGSSSRAEGSSWLSPILVSARTAPGFGTTRVRSSTGRSTATSWNGRWRCAWIRTQLTTRSAFTAP
jgi:2-polyprenyl-3-methyl-5-hydroxy-6-metoxy-1,4-benzoquinol methylase